MRKPAIWIQNLVTDNKNARSHAHPHTHTRTHIHTRQAVLTHFITHEILLAHSRLMNESQTGMMEGRPEIQPHFTQWS